MAAKKGKSVGDAAAVESTRLNVHLSREAHRRLGVHAIMSGVTPGRLVEKLINDHLKEWRVQSNGKGSGHIEDRPGGASPENIPVIPASL